MTTLANITEPFSISDARTGSIRVSRLALTGWGAAPTASAGIKAWSDQGRMWGVFTYASANSGDFSLRRRGPGLYAGTDEVCSGTVANGKVTLAADNTSGITGTADVDDGTPGTNPQADATFDVIVTYGCDEFDLRRELKAADSLLEGGTPTYMGLGVGTRFELLLQESKMELDRWLLRNFEPRLRYDKWGRPLLAHIVRPADLARVQVLIARAMAMSARADLDPAFTEAAQRHMRDAKACFDSVTVQFDYERDGAPDINDKAGVFLIRRA